MVTDGLPTSDRSSAKSNYSSLRNELRWLQCAPVSGCDSLRLREPPLQHAELTLHREQLTRRSKFGLGKNDWDHQSARAQPRHTRMDLSPPGI
jgi:hypothetical protein